MSRVDLAGLARAQAWSRDEVLALPGRMKAALLRDWGVHVNRRFGAGESERLLSAVGIERAALPDAPDPEARVPVGWQLALTRAIADRHLGGDLLRLEALLIEDARRRPVSLVERVARLAVSPRRVLSHAEKIHGNLFDVGACRAELGKSGGTLTWTGARLFAEPTWRVLQCFAIRGMCAVLNERPPTLAGESIDEGFRLHLAW
jgi:hypothetical protein